MKKNKIVGALALMMLGTSPAFAAENSNTNFESTATIENTCLIEADDVNFGQVYAPLTQQGTKSEMRVLCSKNTPYTIDLAYGGGSVNVGSGVESGEYTYGLRGGAIPSSADYNIYKDGVVINNTWGISCSNNEARVNSSVAQIYGIVAHQNDDYKALVAESNSGLQNICINGRLNVDLFNYRAGIVSTARDFGVMNGASKGDGLAYKITVPGDITQVWNTGFGSYKATATGEFEKIEVNAQIVPGSSSSLYLAQDSYFDTVTAVISY